MTSGRITYKSKSVHPILYPIYVAFSIGFVVLILWHLFLGQYLKAFQQACFGSYFIYWFIGKNKDEISIDDEYISTHIAKANDNLQDTTISISEVKKIKFEDDAILNFYDSSDIIMTMGMDNFTKDTIQSILNLLSNKIPVAIDNSLIDEGYTVPQNITNETTSSRRRRVVEPQDTKQASQNHIVSKTSIDNKSAPNRRKLEL